MARPTPDKKARLMLWLEWAMFFLLLLPRLVLECFRSTKAKSIDGKVVVVTGAGRGLGKELALAFAGHGCRVACVDIDEEAVMETVAAIIRDGERAKAYLTNVAKVEEVMELQRTVTKDLGPVDILVNNASLQNPQGLEEPVDNAVQAIVAVNLLAHFWIVRAFLPSMKQRNSGHVVAISSLCVLSSPAFGPLIDSCHWGTAGFMESLRFETMREGFDGIHFTTIYSSLIKRTAYPRESLSLRQSSICREPRVVASYVVMAVRKNMVCLSVPEYWYNFGIVLKLLPTSVMDCALKLASVGLLPTSQEAKDRCDKIIRDTVK